jgi:hypothetical protein
MKRSEVCERQVFFQPTVVRTEMSDGKFAVALHDYAAKNATQLSFSKHDMLCVTHEDSTKQWFRG